MNKEEEKYYISVVDIVSVISESKDGRKYWNKLKQRLKEEENQSVTNCHQLKLKSSDGKYYNTDVVDIEGMFRIMNHSVLVFLASFKTLSTSLISSSFLGI